MKAFKIIGAVVGVFIVILIIVVTMQPAVAHLEKSIVINASSDVIFPYVSDLKKFTQWSPWDKMDPEVKHTYEGTEGTVGSKMNWNGPKTDTGSMWIEEIDPDRRVKSGLTFGNFDTKYHSQFVLVPESSNTKITWTWDGPNDGLSGKAMWVIMGPLLGTQFESGLKDLKALVESMPAK
ncbi:MAG: SRPBCC family protein [Chryseolinea sp.]